MATNQADLEYGPNPPDAEYEHTDIEPAIAIRFAVWLGISVVLAVGIVYGTFWLFEGRTVAQNEAAQRYPLAVGRETVPPAPRLQHTPFTDVYLLKQQQFQHLNSYGWVDQQSGIVHIPIDEAMRVIAERGGIPSASETPAGLNQVVQDSSAGRTSAPRY